MSEQPMMGGLALLAAATFVFERWLSPDSGSTRVPARFPDGDGDRTRDRRRMQT